MKTTSMRLGLGLGVIASALSVLLYSRLPDPMPSHFDLQGHVNGYLPRALGAFLIPVILFAMHALFTVLARRAADAEGAVSAPRVLAILHITLLAFLLFTHVVLLLVATGSAVDVSLLLFGGLGLMLAILGNYLGKLRRNPWIGIRTPWTLADDEIWARTHRLAGPIFVIGGIVLLLAAVGHRSSVVLPVLLVTVFVPSLYSYLLARRPRA